MISLSDVFKPNRFARDRWMLPSFLGLGAHVRARNLPVSASRGRSWHLKKSTVWLYLDPSTTNKDVLAGEGEKGNYEDNSATQAYRQQ